MKRILLVLTIVALFRTGHTETTVRLLDIMLKNYDYPFPVEHITVHTQRQELQMAYMDVSPEKPNGKTMLLFHGKNFNGAYWERTARALLNEGFRVVMPDQIGFGKSSKPHHYHYTFHQLAANTRRLLDSLDLKRVHVTGHSMGGMLATRFTLMYPDLVDKLILLNPIGLEDWKLKVPYKPVEWWYRRELAKDFEAIKGYQKESYYDGTWKDEYDQWVEILAGWTRNADYERIAWNAALTYDMIFTQPVLYEFDEISVPTLLIIGDRDRTALGKGLVSDEVRATLGRYDRLGKATREKIPNAKLVEIQNIGHLPHIESFERFIEPYLTFLGE